MNATPTISRTRTVRGQRIGIDGNRVYLLDANDEATEMIGYVRTHTVDPADGYKSVKANRQRNDAGYYVTERTALYAIIRRLEADAA